ncbi:MAG: hypothetical protein HYY06_19665 [Deltaproteobacteria bacterium]|nr:hypothetical protein [Deltaproteobacteria bacterium]
MARSVKDPDKVLVGEAKLGGTVGTVGPLAAKAARCPDLQGKRLTHAVWILRARRGDPRLVTGAEVVEVLR